MAFQSSPIWGHPQKTSTKWCHFQTSLPLHAPRANVCRSGCGIVIFLGIFAITTKFCFPMTKKRLCCLANQSFCFSSSCLIWDALRMSIEQMIFTATKTQYFKFLPRHGLNFSKMSPRHCHLIFGFCCDTPMISYGIFASRHAAIFGLSYNKYFPLVSILFDFQQAKFKSIPPPPCPLDVLYEHPVN